jgi:hypothetical protein
MESTRHLGMNAIVQKYDIPWEAKKNASVWRGRLTGYNRQQDILTENVMINTNYTEY